GLHAHLLGDLDEDELVSPVLVPGGRQRHRCAHEASSSVRWRDRMVHPVLVIRSTTARALSSAPGRSECRKIVSPRTGVSAPAVEGTLASRATPVWSARHCGSRRWFLGSMMMCPSSVYSRSAKASAATL